MKSLSIKKTVLIFFTLLFAAQPAALTAEQSAPLSNDWSESISRFFYDRWPIIAGVSAGLLAAAVYIYATQPTKKTAQYETVYLPVLQQKSNELCGYYAAFFALNAYRALSLDKPLKNDPSSSDERAFNRFLADKKFKIIETRLAKREFSQEILDHYLETYFGPIITRINNLKNNELGELAALLLPTITQSSTNKVQISEEYLKKAMPNSYLYFLSTIFADKLPLDNIILPAMSKALASIGQEPNVVDAEYIKLYLSTLHLKNLLDAASQKIKNERNQLAESLKTVFEKTKAVNVDESFMLANLGGAKSILVNFIEKNKIKLLPIDLKERDIDNYVYHYFPKASELLDSKEIESILGKHKSAITIIESALEAQQLFEILKDDQASPLNELTQEKNSSGIFIIGTMTQNEPLASGHWLTVVAEKKGNNRTYYVLNSAADHPDELIRNKYAKIIKNFISDLDQFITQNTEPKNDAPLIVIDEPEEKEAIILYEDID